MSSSHTSRRVVKAIDRGIQLAAFDLDGTLLNEKYELTAGVLEACWKARSSGLKLVIATGRDLHSARLFLEQLELQDTVIASGGAEVWYEGRLAAQTSFTPAQTIFILNLGLELEAGMIIDQPGSVWCCGSTNYSGLYAQIRQPEFVVDPFERQDQPYYKISMLQEQHVLEEIRGRIMEMYAGIRVSSPLPRVIDVNPAGGDKGTALNFLAGLMGLESSQVAAVGDSENDLSMFRAAGISIAMGNASETIQAQADLVAPENCRDGAARALEMIQGYSLSQVG